MFSKDKDGVGNGKRKGVNEDSTPQKRSKSDGGLAITTNEERKSERSEEDGSEEEEKKDGEPTSKRLKVRSAEESSEDEFEEEIKKMKEIKPKQPRKERPQDEGARTILVENMPASIKKPVCSHYITINHTI